MKDRIIYIQKTDRGLKRSINEDYSSSVELSNGTAFVLCDGMGGHAKGEVAAKMACEAAIDFIRFHQTKPEYWLLKNCIDTVNKRVYEYSLSEIGRKGMGTTLVIAIVKNKKLFYAHVGDSRLYLIRNKEISQLTQDHSFVEELVQSKLITREEAKNHPRKNEITRAIGINPDVESDICLEAVELQEEDYILLCTDGLTNMIPDNRITEIVLSDESLEKTGQDLIETANKKGGIDNITIVLIHCVKERQRLKNRSLLLTLIGLLLIALFVMIYFLNSSKNKVGPQSPIEQEVGFVNPRKDLKYKDITFDSSCLENDKESQMGWVNMLALQREKMIDFTINKISVEEEMEQGRMFHQAFSSENLVKSSIRLNHLLEKLINVKPRSEYSYSIYEIEGEDINAFTVGGYIYIFSGMMDFIKSDRELAAVISHEIAHNELGHISRKLRLMQATGNMFGQELADVIMEMEGFFTTPFNQKDEVLADLLGVDMMIKANINPCEAIQIWRRMSQKEKKANNFDELFRSHPYSSKRASCIRQHLESNYKIDCAS